jgi:hypothetical protein
MRNPASAQEFLQVIPRTQYPLLARGPPPARMSCRSQPESRLHKNHPFNWVQEVAGSNPAGPITLFSLMTRKAFKEAQDQVTTRVSALKVPLKSGVKTNTVTSRVRAF